MINILRQIRINDCLRHLIRLNDTTKVTRNYLYNSSSFGLTNFETFRQTKQKQIGSEFQTLQHKLTNAIETSNADELQIQDLNNYLTLINNNDQDLNLAINAFKFYLKENYLIHNKNFGELLVKTDYLLNNTSDRAIQLLNDKEIKPSLMTQITSFILMIKFYNNKNHNECYNCFISFIEALSTQMKQELKPTKFKIKSQKQLIPFGHLRLITASLLCLNSTESFTNMKHVIEIASKCNSLLNNTSLASCFLLAINQNEIDYAHKLAARITYKNATLRNNLDAIKYCYADNLNDAIKTIEILLKTKPSEMNRFHGKIFNLTLITFEQLIARLSDSKTERNEALISQMKNKLFKLDLFEYCTTIHSEFND